MEEFEMFRKIPRISRECVITEKIDGTNAQILITEDGQFFTGSRNRWITPENDNFGFSMWANKNREELMKLGTGRHYGEWWGVSIQRGYNLSERRVSLFNTSKWSDDEIRPKCCYVVPVLYKGLFETEVVNRELERLRQFGSEAAVGYMNPEGVVVYHIQGGIYFKKTLKDDAKSS